MPPITKQRKILRFKYIVEPGEYLNYIQLYDVILTEKDLDERFPPRNAKLLKEAGLSLT